MRKAAEWLRTLLRYVLAGGCSVQIFFGLWWMILNIGRYPQYEEGNAGVLYPILLQIARGFESVFRIPYYCFLSVLQLAAAFGVGYLFLSVLWETFLGRGKYKRRSWVLTWGSLVLITIPMAMQSHLAPLPYSLTASVFLLELVFVWKALQKSFQQQEANAADLLLPLFLWRLAALLMPEYDWLGAVWVVLMLLVLAVRRMRHRETVRLGWQHAMAAALTALVIFGAAGEAVTSREHPLAVDICKRVSWSSINGYYDEWPEEARSAVRYEVLLEIASNPNRVETQLWPMLVEQYGEERSAELLDAINDLSWNRSRGRVLRQIGWDLVGYTLPPYAVQQQLAGNAYASYTGRNYDIMRWYTPKLSKLYMDYSCRMFLVGMVLAGILMLDGLVRRRKSGWRKGLDLILLAAPAGLLTVVWYTAQGAGQMDYKNSIALLSLWYVWMLCQLRAKE